jgi:hypothetical protein
MVSSDGTTAVRFIGWLCIVAALLVPERGWAVRCRNGMYVTARWAGDAWTEAEARSLAAHFKGANVENVFVLAKGISASNASRLSAFFGIVRSQVRDAKFIATIGRRVCTSASQKRCVRLANEAVRRDIISEAQRYWHLGFDGVQLDLEPVESGDESLIEILRTLRTRRSSGQFVSLAGYLLRVDGVAETRWKPSIAGVGGVLAWDRGYYRRLIAVTEQIMVMNYDTALRTADDYREFTVWQVRELSSLVPHGVELQMGLPSDVHGRTGFFDRRAENLSTGLAAVERAIANRCPANFGVTVFTVDGMSGAAWRELTAKFAVE